MVGAEEARALAEELNTTLPDSMTIVVNYDSSVFISASIREVWVTLGIAVGLVTLVIFLFLGAFMDWTGIVLLVMPVFLPIVLKMPMEELGLTGGLDSMTMVKVWFGILFCVNMQVSFLSPAFGPAAFYLKSVAPPDITLGTIFKALVPFICLQVLAVAILIIFPGITGR